MPVVTRVDDSVSETESFMIYGEGFDETSKVYISPVTSSDIPEYDDARNLTECEILQRDEKNQCLTVKMTGKGSYNLYVTNENGTSYAVPLNAARPQWVSTDKVADGEQFRVHGKNMSQASFGGNKKSGVSLVNSAGSAYNLPVKTVTPYAIDCIIDKDEVVLPMMAPGSSMNEIITEVEDDK